ncbi:MAG: PEGA domain-containing protein, partial [Candidatus Paceibacterota bacterium]
FFLLLGAITDTGNRIYSAIGITSSGTINVTVPHAGAQLYLNDRPAGQSSRSNETLSFPNLRIGQHTLIVAREGYYPWAKTIELHADETQALRPFLAAHRPPQRTIDPNSSEYRELIRAIQEVRAPSAAEPRVARTRAPITIWVEGDAINARWRGEEDEIPPSFCINPDRCVAQITVNTTDQAVRNLAFYKDRDDVVVFATGNAVYALEVTPHGTRQNFQPIYEGTEPNFVVTGTSTIAVLDDGFLLSIEL